MLKRWAFSIFTSADKVIFWEVLHSEMTYLYEIIL